MPGGDRTGPAGFGPTTGRAAGYCAGFGMPGYANRFGGRGFGGGFGRGGGWRNRGHSPWPGHAGEYGWRGYAGANAVAGVPDGETARQATYELEDLRRRAVTSRTALRSRRS